MWIYKITNKLNGKSYIGQTIRPINQRWHRHVNDAMNNILDTHFARAIRKYGEKSFSVEEIDSASSQEELNISVAETILSKISIYFYIYFPYSTNILKKY